MPGNHYIGQIPRGAIVLLALLLLAAGAHAVTVTAIAPEVGNRGTTVEVTVTGTDFERPVTAALYQTFPLPTGYQEIPATDVQIAASTRLVCTFPIPATAATGVYDLRVESANARPVSYTGFTVLTAPSIASISPAIENTDDTSVPVTITGAGFIQGATVKLYHTFPIPVGYREITAGTVQVASPTKLTCEFSLAGAAHGPYALSVENPGGARATKADAFTVLGPIRVDSITPSSGAQGQTLSTVYVRGANFIQGAQVTLNAGLGPIETIFAEGENVIDSGATIQCSLRIPSVFPARSYILGVTNPGGSWSDKFLAFTVTGPPPTVTGISPARGAPGQTLVFATISGSGFSDPVEIQLRRDATIIPASDEDWVSSTSASCNLAIPLSAPLGTYDLCVKNADSDWGVRAGAFTLAYPPTITASPSPTRPPTPSPTATPLVGVVPGGSGSPTDPDGNGKYEDVNGNLRKDFADVVLYFNQMAWIPSHEPLWAFDFNENGRIDFADVVWLFNHL